MVQSPFPVSFSLSFFFFPPHEVCCLTQRDNKNVYLGRWKIIPSKTSPLRNCSNRLLQKKLQFAAIQLSVRVLVKDYRACCYLVTELLSGTEQMRKRYDIGRGGLKVRSSFCPRTQWPDQRSSACTAKVSLYENFKIARGMKEAMRICCSQFLTVISPGALQH